jgi:ribosomal-protein-serine acetyltransferase
MEFDNYSIRLLTVNDLDSYYRMVEKNRKRLENFFTGTTSRTKTVEDTREFLIDITQRAQNKTYFPYLIYDNDNQLIAGFVDLKNIDWSIPKSEIGCYIDEEYEGKGITSKAVKVFCEHCFTEYNFLKLFLRTHESNSSAQRVAEKCGFQIEGKIRCDYKTTSGEVVDLIYYGRLKSDKLPDKDQLDESNINKPRIKPLDTVYHWVQSFNDANTSALASLYHGDAINHQSPNQPVQGREAIIRMFEDEFSKAKMVCQIVHVYEDDEWAIIEWTDPKGMRGCGFFNVIDGKIKIQRGYWDKLTFLRLYGLPLPTE